MNTFKLSARNIFRNMRRSLMTVSAIAVGAMSMILFGAFISQIFVALETRAVMSSGHLTLYREGYFKYGAGNPAAYGIGDYQSVIKSVGEDPVLKPMINVLTPIIYLFGIAGNFESEASKTFFGQGVIPEDFNRMHLWNEHHLKWGLNVNDLLLDNTDENHGTVGEGLAIILGLCKPLHLKDCPQQSGPSSRKNKDEEGGKGTKRDFGGLEDRDLSTSSPSSSQTAPRLDLLAATAAGAPNVVNFYVDKANPMGFKEADDSFVTLHFSLAQQLLYGRGERKAVGIVLQLHRTEDIHSARARLEQLIREKNLGLEVRELKELQPFYTQAVGMFTAIFSFISAVMAVITLFTVVNTMSMSVMERTHEIGTLRAMGVKKKGITLQFVLEGVLLGVIGATFGIILGAVVSQMVNHMGLTWQPPGQATPVPLTVLTDGVGKLFLGVWLCLCMMATMASWIPARRAAKMTIVDALGHV